MSQKYNQNQINQFEKVPVPAKLKWREFRVRIVPFIMFFAAFITVMLLWEQRVQSPDFIGRVIADQRVITSPAAGVLTGYQYDDFQKVSFGTPLGSIITSDPALLQARLEHITAEIELIRTGLIPATDMQRNALNFTNLKLENLQIRADIASHRVELEQKDREFRRAEQLFSQNLLQEEAFERIRTERDLIASRVNELETLADDLDYRLQNLSTSGFFDDDRVAATIQTSVAAKEAELKVIEAELKPWIVRAPIAGIINQTFRRNGEYVAPGDTIAVVQSHQPTYIVGYLRQPFSVEPEIGMTVEIRSRKPSRSKYESQIADIGAHIQPISRELQRPGAIFESGLPIKVTLWQDSEFYPGEIVDLILRPKSP